MKIVAPSPRASRASPDQTSTLSGLPIRCVLCLLRAPSHHVQEHAAVLGRHDVTKDGPFHKLEYVVNEMMAFEESMKGYNMQYCKVCEERWPAKAQ